MNTKRQRLFLAIMLITISLSIREVSAQSIELTPFAGWQLHGTAKLYDGDLRINDAANFGGKLAVALASTTLVEFSYMRSDTEGRFFRTAYRQLCI